VGKKRKNGMSDLQKIGKKGCSVAKNERNPDQEDDEEILHCLQEHNDYIQKRRENWEKIKECPISKKSRKKNQNDMCALETRTKGTPSLAPWFAMGETWNLEPDGFLLRVFSILRGMCPCTPVPPLL